MLLMLLFYVSIRKSLFRHENGAAFITLHFHFREAFLKARVFFNFHQFHISNETMRVAQLSFVRYHQVNTGQINKAS